VPVKVASDIEQGSAGSGRGAAMYFAATLVRHMLP